MADVNGGQQRTDAEGGEVRPMTRQERRALRQRRFMAAIQARLAARPAHPGRRVYGQSSATSITGRDARLAARLAHLDYKVSGETGAMRVPSRMRTWHLGGRLNGHAPPPGQGWERSGATYVVEADGLGRLPQPVIHYRWRRLMVDR